MNKIAAGALIIVLGVVAGVVGIAALNGFMLSYLWQWFVVPLGVPAIGIIQAIGICMIVSMLTYQPWPKSDDEGSPLLLSLLAKLFGFGVAFVASFWMPA